MHSRTSFWGGSQSQRAHRAHLAARAGRGWPLRALPPPGRFLFLQATLTYTPKSPAQLFSAQQNNGMIALSCYIVGTGDSQKSSGLEGIGSLGLVATRDFCLCPSQHFKSRHEKMDMTPFSTNGEFSVLSTGVDSPHYYYFQHFPNGFKIASKVVRRDASCMTAGTSGPCHQWPCLPDTHLARRSMRRANSSRHRGRDYLSAASKHFFLPLPKQLIVLLIIQHGRFFQQQGD